MSIEAQRFLANLDQVHLFIIGGAAVDRHSLLRFLVHGVLARPSDSSPRGGLLFGHHHELAATLASQQDQDRVLTLDPLLPGSPTWHMAADLADDDMIARFAGALLPDEAAGHQLFFRHAARELLVESIKALNQSRPLGWYPSDLREAATSRTTMAALLNEAPNGRRACQALLPESHVGDDILAVLRNTLTCLEPYTTALDPGRTRFALRDWVTGARIVAFPATSAEPCRTISRCLFELAAGRLLSRDEPVEERTWVVIDSAECGPSFDTLRALLTGGPSKGLQVALTMPGIEAIEHRHGEQAASELLDVPANVVWLKPMSAHTARFAAPRMGHPTGLARSSTKASAGCPELGSLRARQRQVAPVVDQALCTAPPRGKLAGWFTGPGTEPVYQELSLEALRLD